MIQSLQSTAVLSTLVCSLFLSTLVAKSATADASSSTGADSSVYANVMQSGVEAATMAATGAMENATVLEFITTNSEVWRTGEEFLLTDLSANANCARDLRRLGVALMGLRSWALPFADSFGRPQPGLLNGATTWLGSFDQCLSAAFSTRQSRNGSEGFSGSYCLLKLQSRAAQQKDKLTTLITIGTCWPNSCSMSDVLNVTSGLLGLMKGDNRLEVAPAVADCRSRASAATDELSMGAMATLAILCVLGLCLLCGTGIDLFQRSRARSAAAVAASAPVQASAAASAAGSSSVSSSSAAAAAAPGFDQDDREDRNFDSSETAGDEEALIAATMLSRDNWEIDRCSCLGALKSILLCFSVRANAAKLLNQQLASSNLRCVNGIRFITMSWVILGHSYLISLINASNLAQLIPRLFNDWTFQAVLNATVAVDTFFVLSGLLATYLFLREVDRRRGQLKRINWLRFYLHRYWRLTAPYMIILGVYTTLPQYMYDGPRYPRGGFDPKCRTDWWQNLLYINNMYSMANMCMPWTWYLANDMQFYFISPLFLIPMVKRPALGIGAAVLVITASTVGLGIYSTLMNIGVLGSSADSMYIRPWFRIGPYLIGSLAGLIAHRLLSDSGFERRRQRSLRLHWSLRCLGWSSAAALCLSGLYGLFDVERGIVELSQPVASLYNATFRLAWSLGIAWVILACATGNGGLVSDFLSAGVFAPLSRLSYCAYLLHPIIMAGVETARRDTVQWNSWTPIGNFMTYLIASYGAAFGASLALESPLIALERLAVDGIANV